MALAVGFFASATSSASAGLSVLTGPPTQDFFGASYDPLYTPILESVLGQVRFSAQTCSDQVEGTWSGGQSDTTGAVVPYTVTFAVGPVGSLTPANFTPPNPSQNATITWSVQHPTAQTIAFHGRIAIGGNFIDAIWTGTVIQTPQSSAPSGATAAQQSCTVVGKKRFSEQQKKIFRFLATYYDLQSSATSTLGLGCVKLLEAKYPNAYAYICAVVAATTAMGLKALVAKLRQWAADPPDPNFRSIAPPHWPRLPHVRAGGGFSRGGARAVNWLLDDYGKSAALGAALLTAIERAQGASVTNEPANRTHERTQMLAAGHYADQLAGLADSTRGHTKSAVKELRLAGIDFRASKLDVRRLHSQLMRRGFPSQFKRIARALGDPTLVASLRADVAVAKPAPLRFLSVIGRPRLLKALKREAAALRSFAAQVRVDPIAPAP
jgi:hypothetical protein